MKEQKKVIVIGAGFSGLSAAALLAKNGFEVTIYEKNAQAGGRCGQWEKEGFVFDLGPSWYWMPDVFEQFYHNFGKKASDFYELIRLDPSYQVIFKDEAINIPANYEAFENLLTSYEPNAAPQLKRFLAEAQYKYEVGMNDLVKKPALSWFEFFDWRVLKGFFQLHLTQSFSKHIRKYFSHPKIIQLLEFPVLFLGAKPKDTPALYSLMNYADIILGTWYPKGGMYEVSKAFEKIALEQGVTIHYNAPIKSIAVKNNKVEGVWVNDQFITINTLISSADYQHTDSQLLGASFANYDDAYWSKRKLAPSCLLYYIGLNKKLPNFEHHNLFFDANFELHSEEIYDSKKFPTDPLFYVCCPSKTDDSVAPASCENLFILIPVATDLTDNEEIKQKYLNVCLERIEKVSRVSIKEAIIVQRSFGISDFKTTYNAFRGNAYGLANTLLQTAVFKPSIKHKNIKNLYYCGQLSVPGPGVPPSIISGEIVANYIINQNTNKP